ncbi:related to L-fucose permease [Rhynchosporium secalis]|uniref:Related to L-fucose permease n=1 Tax=Rhynchosporium secalis TaxID=38038 RepID=A0A1E1MJ32_RHYSE|nr:related to L-fucose permease [Rhynchosporium secalis]
MQQPPLSVLMSWPAPNYKDPETRGYANVILNFILYSILLGFIGLRIWTRRCLQNAFGHDDTFILLALVPTTGFFVISVLKDTAFLWIRHVYDIPLSHIEGGLKMVMAAEVTFAAAITLTKLSMLMLVQRLLSSASLLWRRITWLAIFIVTAQGLVFCFTIIFQCRPIHDYWAVTIDPQPNCISQPITLLVAGIINTLTDLGTVLLPIRTVWTLQLPKRQVSAVILLFGLGLISCAAGIVRTYYMYQVTTGWDQTWRSYPVWITSGLELYIGIICASIPATRPFFSTYLPTFIGSLTSASTSRNTLHQSNASHFGRNGGQSKRSGRSRPVTMTGCSEEMLDLEKGGSGSGSGSVDAGIGESDKAKTVRGTRYSQMPEGKEVRMQQSSTSVVSMNDGRHSKEERERMERERVGSPDCRGILVVQTFEMIER